jgi:CHAT domain-containing protein/tetratricopeptide (TPR) repeat protein
MDENRVRAYLNLIQLLLTCPAGEEGNVLQEHSEFVDSGLIEVMQQEASRMAADGEPNAGFLQQLAGQISQALGQGTQGGNADRNSAYLQLINALLTCPGGEEPQLLQANSELIDGEFLQVCQMIAENLAGEGQENAADFLRSMTSQLGQLLGMNDDEDSDNSEEENPQEYENFIRELLQAEESYSGLAGVYPILDQRQHLLNPHFSEILQQVAENFIAENPDETANIVDLIENLSIHIKNFPLGKRANNIEIAIAGYQIVLSHRQPGSENWARTQNNLAIAYSNRIRGEKAENIERGIASYTAALEVRTRHAFPEYWAMTQNNLGTAYYSRIRGEKAENIERAIASYTAALEVYKREAFPQDWAMTQNNLATAYRNRIRGEKAENIELAIASYTAPLEVYTREAFPQDWAMTQNNLANAYSNRIRGEKAENIELAIASYSAALEVCTRAAFPQDWAMTQNNLANAYRDRIRGEKAENIERAIAFYTATLEVRTRDAFPQDWATTQNNLGNAYYSRIRGEKAENIERAIASYTAALEVRTRHAFPQDWAMTQNNLGNAYGDRIRGERAENIERAIELYHHALTIITREAFPQIHTEILFNLGDLYHSNQQWQLAYDTFSPAIETVEFLRGEIQSGDESKQKLAEEWNQLYQRMVEVCIELKNYTEALEYAERSKARNLVELLATRDLYPKGEIPETVINELSRLRREIDAEQRRVDIEQTNRNSNGRTISGERSPQIDNLQTTIRDQSHLTQLRRQLDELITLDITPIDRNFVLTQKVEPIPYSEIQSLTGENTTILEWYIIGDKFLTFIITPELPTPIVWKSSTADFEALENLDNEYQKDYKNYTESKSPNKDIQWQQKLTSRLQNLAKILHLDEILKNIPKQCSQLILIPHRFLHLFPLHALPVSPEIWQQFNSEPSSPKPTNPYLLDCFKQGVHYAPSCQILQQAQRRKRPNFTHLFATANPTKDRYLLELQAANICHQFKPNDFLIKKDDANKKAIQSQQLSLANCVHFGCHGKFEPNSPLESALKLANNERLTLLEILNLDLNQCRLVTLSACETGLTESKTSDEYIGLPFGFLLAGSPSMVSTLWEVDELACTLLMMRFYQNLETLSTVNALNEAQQWLRNLTSEGLEEVLELLKPQIDQVFEQLPRKERTRFVKAPLDAALNRKPFPFAEPHYWAGFTAIGV